MRLPRLRFTVRQITLAVPLIGWRDLMEASDRRGQWRPWKFVTIGPAQCGSLTPEMQRKLDGPE